MRKSSGMLPSNRAPNLGYRSKMQWNRWPPHNELFPKAGVMKEHGSEGGLSERPRAAPHIQSWDKDSIRGASFPMQIASTAAVKATWYLQRRKDMEHDNSMCYDILPAFEIAE